MIPAGRSKREEEGPAGPKESLDFTSPAKQKVGNQRTHLRAQRHRSLGPGFPYSHSAPRGLLQPGAEGRKRSDAMRASPLRAAGSSPRGCPEPGSKPDLQNPQPVESSPLSRRGLLGALSAEPGSAEGAGETRPLRGLRAVSSLYRSKLHRHMKKK